MVRRIGARLLVPLLLLLNGGALAAQERVTGTVTSSTGGGLPGVQVTVRGTTTGTLTGADGTYSLAVPAGADSLVFSAVGYATQTVAVGGRSVVDVVLQPQAVALEGLVVVGYGTQQRRDVTGSVATVRADQLNKEATPSVTQMLQGKVAGVQVTPASGAPGATSVVRIRGVGTLNDASPLYVVDGMLLDDVSFLNPNDIQSMEVLKDASATAIYGSRGANGVIIVTTKRGRAGEATRFTVNAYAGMQEVQHPISLVNAQQYAMLANQLAMNTGTTPYFTDPSAVTTNTDWQKEIFRSAPILNYAASAAGGVERANYFFSGDYIRQEGVVPRSDYNRFTLRMNGNYQLTEKTRFGNNLSFIYVRNHRAPGVLGQLYRADPTVEPGEAGAFNDANLRSSAGNPAATVFYTHNTESNGRLVGNLFAERDFLRNFTFRSNFGVDYQQGDFRSFSPVFFVSPTQQNITSNLNVENTRNDSWLWENTLNYQLTTDRSRLSVLGGITAQAFYNELLGGARTDIAGTDPSLWYLNAGNANGQTNTNTAFNWKMLSYLFRTNYSFLDRYLLTASLRVDGSSRFGSANRYGWFPSFALGWDLAQESFLRDVDAVDQLKLRASWGETGNDKIGSYPGIPVVSGNLNAVFGPGQSLIYGASPIALANPDVKWERTKQTDVGADFSVYQGRLSGTLDYYHRLTDGILVQVPIPRYVGVSTNPFVNAASVVNSGLEGTLTWNQSVGPVQLQLSGNGSTIHNEVKSLGQGNEQILGGGLGNEISFTTRTVVGHPIGEFWGLQTIGVFQNAEQVASTPTRGTEVPGDLIYADLNGDGTITDADKTFIGSPIPSFVYGLNGTLDWGGFDLSAAFTGQTGNEIFNGKKAVRFGADNFETSYLNAWTVDNPSNTEPRVTNAGVNYVASDRFIEDGSFFKLNSVQLGYTLPPEVTGRLNMGSARLYVSGTNLFTATDYTGYTPQLTAASVIASGIDLGVYPAMRTFTVGVDVGF
jgi:TonB-linked SusC/RagA family outer membrane protein